MITFMQDTIRFYYAGDIIIFMQGCGIFNVAFMQHWLCTNCTR
jgi:hypothetical protein